MLSLAGRSLRESDEDRALKFCITGFAGQSIEERNDFLDLMDIKRSVLKSATNSHQKKAVHHHDVQLFLDY